jgi:cytochrome c oxidase subunit 2
MNAKRVGWLALLAVVAVVLAVEPATAQVADSTTEDAIWGLNMQLISIAVPITILVEGILIYTVWKFRKNDAPEPTQENRRLEITWTVATAVILLFVGVASYQVLANPYVTASSQQSLGTDEEPLEVQVYGQKYNWEFVYPEQETGNVDISQNFSNSDTLVMPANRPVRFNITSRDWLHAFHVPGLGLKQDAFPGQWNQIQTNATTTGNYQLYCAEYCGVGHSGMLGTVNVTTQETFQDWAEKQQSESSSSAGGSENATNTTEAPATNTTTADSSGDATATTTAPPTSTATQNATATA